jgi:hypothetical protein
MGAYRTRITNFGKACPSLWGMSEIPAFQSRPSIPPYINRDPEEEARHMEILITPSKAIMPASLHPQS